MSGSTALPDRTSASSKPLIAVVGPTASGKSALAFALALRFSGELVNCDTMQMVRGLDVGTAKPPPEERRQVPHHMFDLVGPNEYYSAGRYMTEARKACREISERGSVPVVVGGTGLYLRALLEGLFQGPGKSEVVRRKLRRIAESRGPDRLHQILERKDPVTAGRVAPADRMRVMRALEVYFLSRRPISRWQSDRVPLTGFEPLKIGISLTREVLCARIDQRVGMMFERGLAAEVQGLLDSGCDPGCKGFEAIGYRSVIAYLEGQFGLEEAVELTCRDTRRYAKRQMTWFRKEPGIHWIQKPGEDREALTEAARFVEATFPDLAERR